MSLDLTRSIFYLFISKLVSVLGFFFRPCHESLQSQKIVTVASSVPPSAAPFICGWTQRLRALPLGSLGEALNSHTLPPSTMSSPPNSRNNARSVFSLNASTSGSRPFLNILNPMARSRGYIQANQSVLEEAEEDEVDNTSVFALQNSPRQRVQRDLTPRPTSPGLAANVLRPNIQEEDHKHVRPDNSDSSDDEVPQSLMIEASSPKPRRQSSKSKEKAKAKEIPQRPSRVPLLSRGDSTRPILPTTTQDVKAAYASPPEQTEIDLPDQFPHGYSGSPQPKQMRGLDAYERALWNWVNVYNLDAFLQEVYHYYQGKGIYCIALSRGLNLMSVQLPLLDYACAHVFFVAQ